MCSTSFLYSTSLASGGIGRSFTFREADGGLSLAGAGRSDALAPFERLGATGGCLLTLGSGQRSAPPAVVIPASGATNFRSTSHVWPNTSSGPPVVS